jgi:hypothetical protein
MHLGLPPWARAISVHHFSTSSKPFQKVGSKLGILRKSFIIVQMQWNIATLEKKMARRFVMTPTKRTNSTIEPTTLFREVRSRF